MTSPEWLTVPEFAAIKRLHPSTIRERIKQGAYPAHLVDAAPGRWPRIHASLAQPEPTPIRPADLTHGGREDGDERIARLLEAIKRLRIENLELATDNLKLRAQLAEMLDERRAS